MKRLSKVTTLWSSNLAYVIGVITTDGNLSPNSRSINITSADKEMIINIKDCLGLANKIGIKASGISPEKKYYVVQFGDKNFYEFLENIGLTPNKSKTLGEIKVPNIYFIDFLRGCLDGDGNISISIHPESKVPQLRLRFCSASLLFLNWIKDQIRSTAHIETGWIYSNNKKSMHLLSYGKSDSIKILKNMYYKDVEYYLGRKYKIALPYIT